MYQLPAEILLHIFEYLDAEYVYKTVSLVCTMFKELVHDKMYWKARVCRKFKEKFPALPGIYIARYVMS